MASGPNEGQLLHAQESLPNVGNKRHAPTAAAEREADAADSRSLGASSGSDTLAEGGTGERSGSRHGHTTGDDEDDERERQERAASSSSGVLVSAAAAAAGEGSALMAHKPSNRGRGSNNHDPSSYARPTSYLFESPDPITSDPIPEMQKLTNDVPAKDQVSIILGPFVILACDLVIPCIIYYVWLASNPIDPGYEEEIMGYAVLSFGLGEAYILVVRVYRLIKYRDECGPLLSKHWWELDATSWIYAAALLAGLIPFVVGSTLEIPQLYLYSPGIYMAFLWFWVTLTLLPVNSPVRINSEEAGHRMRPLVYYAAEDFFAVDGWQKRDFRIRYRERYDTSIMFRKMIFELTIWWFAGFIVYIGCLSAVIWNNPFHIAFGLSLGVLFAWIILWAICTYVYVQLALERERQWWMQRKSAGAEKA